MRVILAIEDRGAFVVRRNGLESDEVAASGLQTLTRELYIAEYIRKQAYRLTQFRQACL